MLVVDVGEGTKESVCFMSTDENVLKLHMKKDNNNNKTITGTLKKDFNAPF